MTLLILFTLAAALALFVRWNTRDEQHLQVLAIADGLCPRCARYADEGWGAGVVVGQRAVQRCDRCHGSGLS